MRVLVFVSVMCAIPSWAFGQSQNVTQTTTQVAAQPPVPVSIGSDGSLRYEEPVVEYKPTGLLVTEDARQYPDAIRQIVQGGKDIVPVATVKKSNMVGFRTWRVMEEATLVLAREGDTIVARVPASDADRQESTKEGKNPFGLLALFAAALSVLGNMAMNRGKDVSAALAFTLAALALAFVFALVAPAFIAAALAFVGAGALGSAVLIPDTDEKLGYQQVSAMAGVCMALAVVFAIWG